MQGKTSPPCDEQGDKETYIFWDRHNGESHGRISICHVDALRPSTIGGEYTHHCVGRPAIPSSRDFLLLSPGTWDLQSDDLARNQPSNPAEQHRQAPKRTLHEQQAATATLPSPET